ncbi:hypothetical protein [Streptomyces sp. SID13031]|uniref:hypothetical protein n=1 Tax=Streptomyces sp. SID13031 TaxID=2706046 RepID=UPI0013CBBC49|nr:hypothetical protein [Streptomyces sp. SID13031]NEA35293.1 hypothetical protein [Streptomyces sp. SID13031]
MRMSSRRGGTVTRFGRPVSRTSSISCRRSRLLSRSLGRRNVQRLDTHPRPAKQASYYAETVRWFMPLAAGSTQFKAPFTQWRDKFAYLETQGV